MFDLTHRAIFSIDFSPTPLFVSAALNLAKSATSRPPAPVSPPLFTINFSQTMTNKSILRTIALLLLPTLLLFTACDPALRGNGDLVTETRSEKDFDGLDVSVPGKVVVLLGDEFKVEVQVEENLLPYLKTEVESGDLFIYFSRNVRDVDNLVVTVTMPKLVSVNLSGSVEFVANGAFAGQLLDVDLSGSGKVEMGNINYEKVAFNLSGSGNINLRGEATELETFLSGSGHLNALGCPVKIADIHLSGSGSAKVDVTDKLTAHISGSGEILYEGNPVVDADISGSGRVKKI